MSKVRTKKWKPFHSMCAGIGSGFLKMLECFNGEKSELCFPSCAPLFAHMFLFSTLSPFMGLLI